MSEAERPPRPIDAVQWLVFDLDPLVRDVGHRYKRLNLWLARRKGIRICAHSRHSGAAVERAAQVLGANEVLTDAEDGSIAIGRLRDRWRVPPEQIGYIANRASDLEPSSLCGLRWATSDAPGVLRRQAHHVLDAPAGKSAVGEAVRKLLLARGCVVTRLIKVRKKVQVRANAAAFAVGLRPVAFVLGHLPWMVVQAAGRRLGWLYWVASKTDRERAKRHLKLALPELSESERNSIARRCFDHLMVTTFETLHLLGARRIRLKDRVVIEGAEHVRPVSGKSGPTLFLTAHLGNWELLAWAADQLGLKLHAPVEELRNQALQRAIVRLRTRLGCQGVIVRGSHDARKELRRALSGDTVLAVLIDQDTRVAGDWVPFFGHPAFTPIGPAKIAIKHRMSVVPAFLERQSDGTHICRFHPSFELPTDPVEATASMTRVIEEQVRRCPEQWVWMHRRWRRQPISS